MKQELVKKYRQISFSRWLENKTDYNKLVEAVVEDCLEVIENSKSPGRIVLARAVRDHFELKPKDIGEENGGSSI